MDEDYTLEDFENVLSLKNQLILVPLSSLLEVYQDYDSYLTFLDTVSVMTAVDGAFLLLDECFSDKIEQIMQIHRFSTNDSQVRAVINSIIDYLNGIKCYSSSFKNELKNQYLAYQEECRKACIDTQDLFLSTLAYDAVCYLALKEGDMSLLREDEFFLASVNYFIETIPELFQNKDVAERAASKLVQLEHDGWPFQRNVRNYSRETIKNLKKLKQKEE